MTLDHLGHEVARSQDRQLEATSLAAARAAFLAATSREPAPAWRRWLPVLLLPVTAGLAFALMVLWPRAITVSAPPSGAAVSSSDFFSAPSDVGLPLRFSDGSAVELAPGSSVRVLGRSRRGVTLLLERGRFAASVVHRADTDWRMRAGPFEVKVTGTQFNLAWQAEEARFSLTGLNGSVVVGGCGTGALQVLVTGQSFEATCRNGVLRVGPSSQERAEATAFVPSPPPPSAPPANLAPLAPLVVPVPRPGPREAEWVALARAGRYSEAWESAGAVGLAPLCAGASLEELLLLADCARYAGNYTGARRVFLALRQRFPSTPQAALAAFGLGRLAADALEDPLESERWFQTALVEHPAGPLAQEALGRVLDSRQGRGDVAGARQTAQEYLGRFPEGPHAALARSLVAP